MINSKKGASLSVVFGLLMGLIVLAVILNAMGFFKGANKDLKAANSCEALGGSCVASSSACNSPALQGYGCSGEKPYCCQDNQYNKCSDTTWNSCESCRVQAVEALVLGSPQNGQPFTVKCAYSAQNVPCATMTLSRAEFVLPADTCTVDKELSRDGEVVYNCPGTLLPGKHTLTCGMVANGTAGADPKKTCCVSPNAPNKTAEFTIR